MPQEMSKYLNSPKDADWYACPSCGAEVRVGSAGCQKCRGRADEDDGDHPVHELPEDPDDFDYDEFVKREFGRDGRPGKSPRLPWKYQVGGILLLAALIWLWVLRYLF